MVYPEYYMGFWNYADTGEMDNAWAVNDWKHLGMNLPMSWEYDHTRHDKKVMLDLLDRCHDAGMRVIICDHRVLWKVLTEHGEREYTKNVHDAVKDFGSHPAVFGFHVGDEPGKEQMPDAVKAYRIVRECAPHLTPFINLLPYWEDYADAAQFNTHIAYLDETVRAGGFQLLCYDYYGQMATNDADRLMDLYFKNLNLFGTVARKNGIPLWTTLLSVAHYNSKALDETDIVWQIATAVAHGCTGILWFYIYFPGLFNGSYRDYPVGNFRCPEEVEYGDVFRYLSRQNRIFMRYFADKLGCYIFDSVRHFNHSYGFTPLFQESEFEVDRVEIIVNKEAPLIFSRFLHKETSRPAYLIVNNDRKRAVKLRLLVKNGEYIQPPDGWLAPGQMAFLEL